MRRVIVILAMLFSINCIAQDFSYKIKIQGVESISDAKMITDPLRYVFNVYPTFNDDSDCFEFKSELNITQSDIYALLQQHGYVLSYFIVENNIRNLTIEK